LERKRRLALLLGIVVPDSIQLLVLDVDGVLTDGRIFIDDEGRQSRAFHIQDGLGIAMWRAVGRQTAILTSKQSPAVVARANMLGIELLEQGQEDKLPGFERLLKRAGVTAGQTAYVGDDLLDAAVMRRAGISIAVRNAVEEIKVIASHVTRRAGGEGAVREAVEHLLNRENVWREALEAIGANR
jgi:3-deoxy-D-manno-octulosonate 8-phosphate phosphatase (KDO 8-P phosphatase)